MGDVRRPGGAREQLLVVCALIGAAQSTWGAVVPVLPLLEQRFALGVTGLGVVVAAFGAGRVLGNVPAGLLLARLPARPIVRIAALALSAVTAATALAADPVLLVALRVATGALGGAVVTAAFAVLLRTAAPSARGRAVAVATVVQLSAAAVGSLLGGAVLQFVGAVWVFPCAALPLLLVVLWDTVRPAAQYWAAPEARPAERGGRVAGGGVLAGLLAVTAAIFVVRFAGEQGLVPLLAYGPGGLDPIGLGAALAVGTLASLLVLPFVGRWLDRGARIGPTLVASLVAAGAVVLIGLTSGGGFVAALVAMMVASSVLGVVPGVVTAERFPPARVGVVVGLTRTAGDLAAAAGPLLVLAVADAFSPVAALVLLALLLLAGAAAFAGSLGRRRVAAVDAAPA